MSDLRRAVDQPLIEHEKKIKFIILFNDCDMLCLSNQITTAIASAKMAKLDDRL